MKSHDTLRMLIIADKLTNFSQALRDISKELSILCEASGDARPTQTKVEPESAKPEITVPETTISRGRPKYPPRYLTRVDKEQIRKDFSMLSREHQESPTGIWILANRFKCTPKQVAGIVRRFRNGIAKR